MKHRSTLRASATDRLVVSALLTGAIWIGVAWALGWVGV